MGPTPHITGEQLLQLLGSSVIDQQMVMVTITPDLARALLERYTKVRRPLHMATVARIEHQLKHPDPEGSLFERIRVTGDGTVIAGQHLLHTVAHSGVTAPEVLVLLGASPAPWQ